MNVMKPIKPNQAFSPGFTLTELLVTVAIIAVLAALSVLGLGRMIDSGKKVKTLAQFRDFKVGMAAFEGDYMRPPVPRSKRDTGWDTIYGDPGGLYSNAFLIAALSGEDKDYPYIGENFSSTEVNPRNNSYVVFPYASDKIYGIGPDGRLYDAWGGEIMVAINGMLAADTTAEIVDFNNGQNDRRLHTWGLAEYTETKPREQSYVLWSYGKDKKKGKEAATFGTIVPLAGSDDVVSW
jgi:prepilin-type N-terminal cleavage/methylation domain-containing protein